MHGHAFSSPDPELCHMVPLTHMRRRVRHYPAPSHALALLVWLLAPLAFASPSFLVTTAHRWLVHGFFSHPHKVLGTKIAMRGKSQGPPRQHRPWHEPFAVTTEEVTNSRISMFEYDRADEELQKNVTALLNGNLEQRRSAVEGIMNSVPEKWEWKEEEDQISPMLLEALTKAVMDDDWKVRWDATLALSRWGKVDMWAVDPYIARLAHKLKQNRTSVEDKVILIQVFGRLSWPGAFYSRAVGAHLEHPDPRLRLASCQSLLMMDSQFELFKDELVRLKRDDCQEVREAAEAVIQVFPVGKSGSQKNQHSPWRWRILRNIKNKKYKHTNHKLKR
mmetsp:Transcript_14792/g.29172  ORF Transcript_14792/g.29172 Transcript_14792/m.29172 type:complete len:334 (-) Transcript_14792:67-1068(-)